MRSYYNRINKDVELLLNEKKRREEEAVRRLWASIYRDAEAIVWAFRKYNENLAKYIGYDKIDVKDVEAELRAIVNSYVADAKRLTRKITRFWITEAYIRRLLLTAKLADTTDDEIRKMCTINGRLDEECWRKRIEDRNKARKKLKRIINKNQHITRINAKIERYLNIFEQVLIQMREKVLQQIDNTMWYFILNAMRSKKTVRSFDETITLNIDGNTLSVIKEYREGKITLKELLFRTPLKIDIKVETDGIIANHSLGFKYSEISLAELYHYVDLETKQKLDIIRHFAPGVFYKKFHIVKYPFRYIVLAKKLVYVVKIGKKKIKRKTLDGKKEEVVLWVTETREETDKKKIVAMLEAFNKGKLNTSKIRPVYLELENGERIYPTVYKYDKGKKVRFYIPLKRIFTHREGVLKIYVEAKYPLLDYCRKLEMEEKQCSILSEENELSIKIPLLKITVKFHGTYPLVHQYYKKYWRLLRHKIKRGEIEFDEDTKKRILELTEEWLNRYGQRNSMAVEIAVDGKKLRNPNESYILKIMDELRKLNSEIRLPRNHTVKYWWILPLHSPETSIGFGNQKFSLVTDDELKKIKRLMRRARIIGKTVKPKYRVVNGGKDVEVEYTLLWHRRALNHIVKVIRGIPKKVKVFLVNNEYNLWVFEGNSVLEIISRHHQEHKRVLVLTKPGRRLIIKHLNPDVEAKSKQILLRTAW